MTPDDHYRWLVYLTAPAAVLFPIIYSRVTWWRDWVGRALMVKALGVAIILVITFMYQAFGPDYRFRDELRVIGMALVMFGLYTMLVNAVIAQRGVESTWRRAYWRLTGRRRRSREEN